VLVHIKINDIMDVEMKRYLKTEAPLSTCNIYTPNTLGRIFSGSFDNSPVIYARAKKPFSEKKTIVTIYSKIRGLWLARNHLKN
jgi:hypothetical protein